ncbi:MAG: substrate-binding domain-containing protein [Phycisphaerae bacterium]|nr:substrate-binding domain-containing protein [Phycisphaerae bacterium]
MPSRSETRIRTRPALHRKLTDLILDEIHSGRLPLGAKLPSQAELVARYQVSVNTVRQSLATLEKRGIIRKEHGRGSFVSLQSGRREERRELGHLGLIFERADQPEDQAAETEIVSAFVDVCRRRGIRFTCVETTVDAHAGGGELIRTFDGVNLDAICVFLHSGEGAGDRLAPLAREFAAPVAMFPSFERHPFPIDRVDIDLEAGLRQLMQYLLQLGHRRIAYVSSHVAECLAGDPQRITGGRWQAYRDALAESGVAVDPSRLVEIPYGREPDEAIGRRVIELVRRDDPVTAIFAGNDWMARHVMEWLWRAGIHVPRDVSLAGLDDVSFARHLVPPLTTVACPYTRAARAVIELMRKRLGDVNRPPEHVTIPSELVIRESVRPAGEHSA